MPELTAEIVQKLFSFDRATGQLIWKFRSEEMFQTKKQYKTWNSRYGNRPACENFNKDGYKKGTILGKTYATHRVIWLYVHGEWPKYEIDHINGVRSDNRIENLRAVSKKENMRNQSIGQRSKTGILGVTWNTRDNRYHARIKTNDKEIHLGYFENLEDAKKARKAAERKHGFHPNHGRAARALKDTDT